MKDFNVTIGNATVSTSMIEEDVIRLRMGLKPKGEDTMKNKVEWIDIIRIDDEYYLERHDITFEEDVLNHANYLGDNMDTILENIYLLDADNDCLYNCSDFFDAVREKYNLDEYEEIETYMLDDIDLPEEVCQKFDIAWLGGYINGMNI